MDPSRRRAATHLVSGRFGPAQGSERWCRWVWARTLIAKKKKKWRMRTRRESCERCACLCPWTTLASESVEVEQVGAGATPGAGRTAASGQSAVDLIPNPNRFRQLAIPTTPSPPRRASASRASSCARGPPRRLPRAESTRLLTCWRIVLESPLGLFGCEVPLAVARSRHPVRPRLLCRAGAGRCDG